MGSGSSNRLTRDDTTLLVVDVQARLMPQIHESERVNAQCVKLIEGAKVLGIPIVWTEQYKKGLGDSTAEIIAAVGDAARPMEKLEFGCLDNAAVLEAVKALGRPNLVLCGIEAHICVTQTALRGLEEGLNIVVAEDAVSSRRERDAEIGIARMRKAGAVPANVEMLLMEWLGAAGTPEFKQILPIIK